MMSPGNYLFDVRFTRYKPDKKLQNLVQKIFQDIPNNLKMVALNDIASISPISKLFGSISSSLKAVFLAIVLSIQVWD